jgi:diguanylate cyclase (GGDEF)-like protein
MAASRPVLVHPRNWAVRAAPRGVLPYYLATELVAAGLTLFWPGPGATGTDWARLATLLVIGVGQAELSGGTEKIRRFFAGVPHVNMTSVWIFAGALILPPVLAATLTSAIYAHLWLRVWRPIKNRPAYRVLFSGSTMVLACVAVRPVLLAFGFGDTLTHAHQDVTALFAVAVAIVAFTTVNSVLIMIGLKLHRPERDLLSLLGSWGDNALELATLCLGGATAALLVSHPVLTPLVLLPVVVLHRCVLVSQLEEMVSQDPKTGLLTDVAWTNRAASELARAERARDEFAVLFIDLDNFKRINDTYGHQVGDQVLQTVARTIRGEVRAYDSVGRFGGDECAVLMPEIPEGAAISIAERIRDAISRLRVPVLIGEHATTVTGLSASIGVATYPEVSTVEMLVRAADKAMYLAKENGRNRVMPTAGR